MSKDNTILWLAGGAALAWVLMPKQAKEAAAQFVPTGGGGIDITMPGISLPTGINLPEINLAGGGGGLTGGLGINDILDFLKAIIPKVPGVDPDDTGATEDKDTDKAPSWFDQWLSGQAGSTPSGAGTGNPFTDYYNAWVRSQLEKYFPLAKPRDTGEPFEPSTPGFGGHPVKQAGDWWVHLMTDWQERQDPITKFIVKTFTPEYTETAQLTQYTKDIIAEYDIRPGETMVEFRARTGWTPQVESNQGDEPESTTRSIITESYTQDDYDADIALLRKNLTIDQQRAMGLIE